MDAKTITKERPKVSRKEIKIEASKSKKTNRFSLLERRVNNFLNIFLNFLEANGHKPSNPVPPK